MNKKAVDSIALAIAKVADLLTTLFSSSEREKRWRLKLDVMERRAIKRASEYIDLTEQIENYYQPKLGLSREEVRKLRKLERSRRVVKARFKRLR